MRNDYGSVGLPHGAGTGNLELHQQWARQLEKLGVENVHRAVLGRLEEALADCDEALRLAPGDPATLDSRAWLQRR